MKPFITIKGIYQTRHHLLLTCFYGNWGGAVLVSLSQLATVFVRVCFMSEIKGASNGIRREVRMMRVLGL